MFIRIEAGVFGYQSPTGKVIPIRAGEFVEVDDKIGARLIKKSVAVEAELLDELPEGAELEGEAPEQEEPDDEAGEPFPKYNADMTRAELEEIALQMGAEADEVAGAKNKAAVIALLDELKAEFEGEAPELDAAAAIQ